MIAFETMVIAPTAMPRFVYGKEPASWKSDRILSRLVEVCAQNAITTREMMHTSTRTSRDGQTALVTQMSSTHRT